MTLRSKRTLMFSLFALLAALLIAPPVFAGSMDPLDFGNSGMQISKSQRGAYVGFTYRWGGARPAQMYLVTRSFLPAFGSPVSAMAGTVIPLNSIDDLNFFGWSRRNQGLTLVGAAAAIWFAKNNRGSHTGRYVAPVSDDEGEENEEDSDEDSDFEHCYDGNGYDNEYNEQHCF